MAEKYHIHTMETVTGCSGRIAQKNADGTVTKIKYESAVPLQRAPYFEQYTDHVQGTLL